MKKQTSPRQVILHSSFLIYQAFREASGMTSHKIR